MDMLQFFLWRYPNNIFVILLTYPSSSRLKSVFCLRCAFVTSQRMHSCSSTTATLSCSAFCQSGSLWQNPIEHMHTESTPIVSIQPMKQQRGQIVLFITAPSNFANDRKTIGSCQWCFIYGIIYKCNNGGENKYFILSQGKTICYI